MEYILSLNKKIGMPDEAVNEIIDTYNKIIADHDFHIEYHNIHALFFAGGEVTETIMKIAETYEVEPYLLILTFFEMYSETTKQLYKEMNISDDIFFDTMSDITIWAKVCKRDFNMWGLRESNWLKNHLRAQLFRLGRMQYHTIKFNRDSYHNDYIDIKRGDTVINMHIPEGEPLTKERRIDSYKKACEFFKLNIIVCDSWLLYPKPREFLPPTSNILSFMDDFDIFDSDESDSVDNMWRIFNRRQNYIPSELPRDTSFRRAYADWLEKTSAEGAVKTGSGYGIFYFDGEKIHR
jgi:hypothetical protein